MKAISVKRLIQINSGFRKFSFLNAGDMVERNIKMVEKNIFSGGSF
tara:strand:- start:658 stop:795 length:138 start_codon:yes stop_codon:yes gene_type:complete